MAYRWTHRLRGCPFLELLSSERCPAVPSSAQESVRGTGESWWLKERGERKNHGEVTSLHGMSTWTTAQHWPQFFLSLYCLNHGYLVAALSSSQRGTEDGGNYQNSYKMTLKVAQFKSSLCVEERCDETSDCGQKKYFLLPERKGRNSSICSVKPAIVCVSSRIQTKLHHGNHTGCVNSKVRCANMHAHTSDQIILSAIPFFALP